jgi:hypothetical protein
MSLLMKCLFHCRSIYAIPFVIYISFDAAFNADRIALFGLEFHITSSWDSPPFLDYKIATPFGGLATPPGTYNRLLFVSITRETESTHFQRHTAKEESPFLLLFTLCSQFLEVKQLPNR